MQALALMVNENRQLSNREYRELFGVTTATALGDLTSLVKKGQASIIGSGRASRYIA